MESNFKKDFFISQLQSISTLIRSSEHQFLSFRSGTYSDLLRRLLKISYDIEDLIIDIQIQVDDESNIDDILSDPDYSY